MQENSSFIHACRSKEETVTFGKCPNVIVQTEKAILLPNKTFKHANLNHPLQLFVYNSFCENENLCALSALIFACIFFANLVDFAKLNTLEIFFLTIFGKINTGQILTKFIFQENKYT